MNYFIGYEATKTDAKGRGTKSFPRKEAQRYCDEMNEKDKDLLRHFLVPDETAEVSYAHPLNWADHQPPGFERG